MSKSQENTKKYLKAPTMEDIEAFKKEIGVNKNTTLEKFYGMPSGTMRQVKCGNRELPAKFWHIIYEKIKPAYGFGFIQKDLTISNIKPFDKSKALKSMIKTAATKNVTSSINKGVITDKLAGLLGD